MPCFLFFVRWNRAVSVVEEIVWNYDFIGFISAQREQLMLFCIYREIQHFSCSVLLMSLCMRRREDAQRVDSCDRVSRSRCSDGN